MPNRFKVNSRLLIKDASDNSGVLVFICFSSTALYFHVSLYPALIKINSSDFIDKEQVDSYLAGFSVKDKKQFWDSLLNNYILIKSEKD